MAQLLTIGPRGYQQTAAVATTTFTPLFDRAAIVTNVEIVNPSAADNWTFSVGGREIMRTRVNTVGQNNLVGGQSVLGFPRNSLFRYMELYMTPNLWIPVPNGQTITIASVGGATANIMIEFEEVDIGDVTPAMPNHYLSNTLYMPVEWHLAAGQTAAGVFNIDTVVAPQYVQGLLSTQVVAPGWRYTILALWLQAASVNTFSGAANHVSSTNDLRFTRNGEQYFTRSALGLPLLAQAAAAGAANTVFEDVLNPYPPFQRMFHTTKPLLDPPIVLNAGDTINWQLDLTGDLTGTASYANAMQQALLKVERLGS